MKIIAGLGNPGMNYATSRHNSGFMAVDALAAKLGISFDRTNFDAQFAQGFCGGEKVILLKPQTFMNLSGQSVCAAVRFYKVDWEDVLIIFDDMDLNFGDIRIRRGGSSGGHNGIKNIIALAGTDKIPRIKIGVGHQLVGNTIDHVLQPMHGDLLKEFLPVTAEAADAAICWCEKGIAEAMNVYNKKKKAEKAEENKGE